MIFFKRKFLKLFNRNTTNRNLYKKYNTKQRKLMFPKLHIGIKTAKYYYLVVPSSWSYVIFFDKSSHKYTLYLYSSVYYFYIPIPVVNTPLNVSVNNQVVVFSTRYYRPNYSLGWLFLLRAFNAFTRPFFFKVKFKGKGYYIYKNKKQTITPQFGHSHRLYLYAYYASVYFLSKTHIFIFGLVRTDVLEIAKGIRNMRPINIFTGRGVRFSRQVIYKKTGKVSSYR